MMTAADIGAKMGRTEMAINAAASRFGLPRRKGLSPRPSEKVHGSGQQRECMACDRTFWSEGNHNRMCTRCRAAA